MAQMNWYTTLRNTLNEFTIDVELADSIVVGNGKIAGLLAKEIRDFHARKKRPCFVTMDGYLGTDWEPVIEGVSAALSKAKLDVRLINANSMYKPRRALDRMVRSYTETDPSLGTACTDKRVIDLLDKSKIERVRKNVIKLKRERPPKLAAVVCFGIGSATPALRRVADKVLFYDMGRVSVMKRKFSKTLKEPGRNVPEKDFYWKKLLYVYYHILDRHRKAMTAVMDGYVDANEADRLKYIPRAAYDAITDELTRRPLKFRRFMQPGNWGGLHHRKYFNLPHLKNCAWDTTFYAPKNSCLVDLGIGCNIEIPFLNIQLKAPKKVCGPYLAKKYPGLLPMIACVDDGYFPKPVHHERSNMPIHLHPDGKYVKKNFNERLGRYETYYIVEAYENANTMLGFTRDADVKEFRRKIVDARRNGEKFDWTKYVKTWPSRAGDLYLIPAGSVHGTGGHQMVLEMDTCPSNVGTEYSFFIYDFLRSSWDDNKKAFCAPPVRLQIDHGFAQTRWHRREDWVKKHLLAKPNVIRKGRGWTEDRYASYGPMPFTIERLHFEKKAPDDTKGRFCHLVLLTKGDRALIRSKKHPERQIEIEWIQFAFIPACFGAYECINIGTSDSCTIVKERWKK